MWCSTSQLDYATLVTNLDFFEHTVGVFFNISAALPVQPLVESELLIGGYEDFGFGEHITLLGLVLYGKGGGATGHTLAQRRIQCARLLLQRGADGSAVPDRDCCSVPWNQRFIPPFVAWSASIGAPHVAHLGAAHGEMRALFKAAAAAWERGEHGQLQDGGVPAVAAAAAAAAAPPPPPPAAPPPAAPDLEAGL